MYRKEEDAAMVLVRGTRLQRISVGTVLLPPIALKQPQVLIKIKKIKNRPQKKKIEKKFIINKK